MPAPTGNSNAQKWSLEDTLASLKRIGQYAEMDHMLTLGQALQKAGLYQGIWAYWRKKWVANADIMDQMYAIDQIFMNKLIMGGLTRRLHSGLCIFLLKANYGMSDRHPKSEEDTMPAYLAAEFKEEAVPAKEATENIAAKPAEKPAEETKNTTTEPAHAEPIPNYGTGKTKAKETKEEAYLRAYGPNFIPGDISTLIMSEPPADRPYVRVGENEYIAM